MAINTQKNIGLYANILLNTKIAWMSDVQAIFAIYEKKIIMNQ